MTAAKIRGRGIHQAPGRIYRNPDLHREEEKA